MKIISTSTDCEICKWIKKYVEEMNYANPLYVIPSVLLAIMILLGAGVSVDLLKEAEVNEKYKAIVKDKPILKCGNSEDVTVENYKIFLIDEQPIIKVFYSETDAIEYEVSDCSVIKMVVNPELGNENVKPLNERLTIRVKDLNSELANVKIQLADQKKLNSKIKKDYKLPTYKELDTYYAKFKKQKGKDFESYIKELREAERVKLATARVETPNTQDVTCPPNDKQCEDLMFDPWQ